MWLNFSLKHCSSKLCAQWGEEITSHVCNNKFTCLRATFAPNTTHVNWKSILNWIETKRSSLCSLCSVTDNCFCVWFVFFMCSYLAFCCLHCCSYCDLWIICESITVELLFIKLEKSQLQLTENKKGCRRKNLLFPLFNGQTDFKQWVENELKRLQNGEETSKNIQ